MVVPQSVAPDSQDGATKESIVLSRIRMLDARLSNGDKSSPSAHTRKYVHPFNRTTKNNTSTSSNTGLTNGLQEKTQHRTESRDTDSSVRPTQNANRDTLLFRPSPPKSYPPKIDTDQEHLSQIRNSSPRGDRGSPLRRDDTVHTFASNHLKPGNQITVRNVSPIKQIRYSPSPIRSHTMNVDTASAEASKSNRPDLQNHLQNQISSNNEDGVRRKVDESPFKAIHPFNELQKKKATIQTHDASSKTIPSTASSKQKLSSAEKLKILPSRVATHFARNEEPSSSPNQTDSPAKGASRSNDASLISIPAAPDSKKNVSSAEKLTSLPSRVATHFARNEGPSPSLSRTDSPAKTVSRNYDEKNKALSPAGARLALQRHHWDKGNFGSTDSNSGVTKKTPSSTNPVFVLDNVTSSGKVKKDPSPRNANNRVSKPEPEPGIILPFQTKIQREYRKIPPSPKRTAAQLPKESTLQRNLTDASAVMQEEKISSVGSSSSSGRSGLSQSELGGIAAKALALSTATSNKTKARLGNTTLQQIVSTKRTSNYSSQGVGPSRQTNTVPYAYSSAQKLSERLTRAERFTALKNAKQSGRAHEHQSFDEPTSPTTTDHYAHPIFGYPKNSIVVNTTLASEGKPLLSPEPSCVRRSKHLSKALQNKANQFALASPSRRSKGSNTGFVNSHEVHAPFFHRNHDPTPIVKDQHRSDPLRLQPGIRSLPQLNGSLYDDRVLYNQPADNHQHNSYGTSCKQKNPIHTKQNINFHTKNAPKQPLGLMRTGDHKNSHPLNHNQQASKLYGPHPSKNALTPGQQLEILAREQRSKFQEDEARYRNVNVAVTNLVTNEENDNNSTYSDDGVSSVDGDIFYDETEPASTNNKIVESQAMSHQIPMNQIPDDYSRKMRDNHQSNTHTFQDIQQSYRHISKRPEPIPMAHPSEPPVAACDNTFTGSLNKQYIGTTPVTANENTFNGSLNQNVIISVNDSSDSSAAKPDAFRWLHQKYGNQTSTVPDTKNHNQLKPPIQEISKHLVSTQDIIGNDEDDDIFFGLDEANTDEDPEQLSKERSSSDKMPSPHLKKDPKSGFPPEQQEKALRSKNKAIAKEGNSRNSTATKVSPRNMRFAEDEINEQSESDQDTSLHLEEAQKRRCRPFPVETILEEARVSLSGPKCLEGETKGADVESEQDENKPPPSVLKNLGSVIVKSIQRACAIPEELPDLGACAMNTKMKCEEKMSEAWVGLDEDENVTSGDASRTTKTTDTGGVLNENNIGASTTENDDCSQMSESSSNIQSHEQFIHRRNEAESKLLHHAETAMVMFGNNNTTVLEFEDTDKVQQKATLSTDSSTTQGPKPLEAELSPTSRGSVNLSIDQRMVLQAFSTCLKKGGVEVLKLSSWNIWQVRYLTISREAMKLDGEDENDAAQCPKALLWLKQTGKSLKSRSLSSIKDNGRGGMLFETMKQVVRIESNEYYDRNLPKRLKKKFPEFAGVLVHYMLHGNDRHVHFCFKTKQDAQSFITTMRIIQEAGKRTSEIESTPTASSGTKSHED